MTESITERSTFGRARHVDSNVREKYVLARLRYGEEVYYTGFPKKIGAATSVRIENARTYDSAREAYDEGDTSISLNWFKACKAYPTTQKDGFIQRWWSRDLLDACP